MEEKKNTKVEETVEAKATETTEPIETTAETVAATPVIPMKTKVANFVYNHRTAIVGIVAGVAGMVGGLIVGGKTGFKAGVNSVKTDAPDQIPTTDVPEIPTVEIPTDVNIEL